MSVSIVSFKVTGLSPLLMNNPVAMQGPKGGLSRKQIPTPEDEAKSKLYSNAKGELILPTLPFRAALLGACTGRRLGKVGAKTVIAASVFNTDTETVLCDPDTGKPLKEYKINVVRCVIQGNGVLRARPEIPRWSCNVDFELDNDFIPNPDIIVELMNIAGKVRGVGDWRPHKGGPYGRFRADLVSNVIQKKKIA